MKRSRRDWPYALVFLAPSLVGITVFTLLPIFASFGLAFTDWNLLRPPSFVGLENFRAMFSDEVMWVASSCFEIALARAMSARSGGFVVVCSKGSRATSWTKRHLPGLSAARPTSRKRRASYGGAETQACGRGCDGRGCRLQHA